MGNNPTVTLRVYRGDKVSYNQDGSIQNENQTVKLPYNSIVWRKFMENLVSNGYCKVDVENVAIIDRELKDGGFEFKSTKQDKSAIAKEVQETYIGLTVKPMSKEEQRIKDLEEKIAKLMSMQEEAVIVKDEPKEDEVKEEVTQVKDDEDLTDQYIKVFGKKPFHAWDEEKIKIMIEEKLSEKA